MQFLANDASQLFFQILMLHGLPQGLVDQRLIASLARLRLEVFNEASIKQYCHASFARRRLQTDAERRVIQVCLGNIEVFVAFVRGWRSSFLIFSSGTS